MVDFIWGAKSEIEVLKAASCHVFFQASHGNALSAYDAQQCIKQAVAGEPLFLQYNQETSTVHVGYGDESSVDALFNALDQRTVNFGQSLKVKIRVRRDKAEGVVAAASQEWEDDILEEGEVDIRSIQEDLFQQAKPGHRPDTIVLRELPCKWFGIASEEAGASQKLRTQIEHALVTIPTRVDAVFLPCGLLMDVYIQFARLVEVEKAFARFQRKALKYENSPVVKPVVVSVDRSGFFTEAQSRARQAVKEREAQARQALEGKRIRLGKERKEIAALLKALHRNEDEDEDDDKEEKEDRRSRAGIRAELAKLSNSLAEADEIDQRLIQEPGRMAAQRMVKEIGELQHHCRRGVAAIEAELDRLREEAHEKQRLDEVREVRVAQARALKESDHRWRVGLEGLVLSKEARQSKLCASFIKSTESALAEARDLVLREAHKIINLEEYFQRLQGSLKEAEKKVASALRLLRLDRDARELEASFKENLCASMKEAGEDALPKRRESGEGGTVDTVAVERDGGLDEALPRFLHCPSRATTYRKALAAALLLSDRRRSEEVQKDEQERVEEFALVLRKLQGHLRSLLPAWELYSKLRLWQVRLKRLWQQSMHGLRGEEGRKKQKQKGEKKEEGKEGKQEPVPVILNALEAAKVALQAAVAFLVNVADEGADEDEEEKENAVEAALFMLQQAVGDAEGVICKVEEKKRMRREVLRRLAEEKALEERNRNEEMRAKAREETMGQHQLERLERRRAHLEASLRREEARDRLEEMKAAGLLPFPEAESSPRGGKGKDEMEWEEEGVALSVMGEEGSKAVVIAPAPIEDRERWSMVPMEAGPPLNLAWADALPNLVSADYWTRKRQQEAVGVESARAGYLRSEVVVIGAGGVIIVAAAVAAAAAAAAAAAGGGKRRHSDPLKIKSPRASSKKGSHKAHKKRGSTGSTGEQSSKKPRSVVVLAT